MQEVKVCSEVGLLENGELIGQSQKKKKKEAKILISKSILF